MADETQSNVPAIPDYMKKFITNNQEDAASMATSSISIPRLSYRGKRWRFIEGGEEVLVPELVVPVIVLGVEPAAGKFIKTFYLKGYQPGDSDPPTCSSTDGVRPDAWVTAQQADLCANCGQNVFGSATSMAGGKAKACKDGKRLWVSRPEEPKKFYGLNIPVMSLKNLSEYGKYVGRNQYPLSLVITELGLDDDSEFPKITFAHKGFVEEANVEVVAKINTERPWRSTFAGPLLDSPGAAKALPQPGPVDVSKPVDVTPAKQGETDAGSVDEVVGSWGE